MQFIVSPSFSALRSSSVLLVAGLVLAACGDTEETVDTPDTTVDAGGDATADGQTDGQGGMDADASAPDSSEPDADTSTPDAGTDSTTDTGGDIEESDVPTDTGADVADGSGDPDATPDATADATDTDGSGEEIEDTELDLAGVYQDNFGGVHRIFNDVWVMGWTPDAPYFTIASFDDESNVVIAQNGAENTFSPSLWSRFDWTASGESLYFCQTAYGAESEEAAELTPAADAGDLEAGCSGFSWSELIEGQGDLAIAGIWVDNYDSAHDITSEEWLIEDSTFTITQFDNSLGYVIAQNGSENEFSADLWSRFDFAWDSFGSLYYCQIAYGAADEASALGTAAADRGGFDTDGCGGFPWSQLLEPSEGSGDI